MDAVVLVTLHPENAAQTLTKETLYPPRHKMTLPLNSLNNYFQNCEIAFNHHTKLDCDRNYFLDFDGWGLMSSLDQNFNPSMSDIERRSQLGKIFIIRFLKKLVKKCFFLGYSRLLSGDMLSRELLQISKTKQSTLFPESDVDKSWEKTDVEKKYFLNFPFYPFRTLNSRDLNLLTSSSSSKKPLEFDHSSPLFPAHTQLDLVFQKRKKDNFLPYMLPYSLPPTLGSTNKALTAEELKQATLFSVVTRNNANAEVSTKYIIKKVEIKVSDIYLQVIRFFFLQMF
jgi:hypothetical protein